MKSLLCGLALALAIPSAAWAGKCDTHAKKAASAKGDALVGAYTSLLACSKEEAEMNFDAFMKASADVDTLVNLSLASIEAESFVPVWHMIEKLPYENREAVTEGIGAACEDNVKVITFLQGAYAALKDVEFGRWESALRTCKASDLTKWLDGAVANPPSSTYNEKYSTLLTAYARRQGASALPGMQRAAVKVAKDGGPFNAILEKMDQAVQPAGIGEEVSAKDRKVLTAALVSIAKGADAEHAKMVADRLFNAGAEEAAASLLPTIYSDRLDGGKLQYGAASIEACEKQAIVHWTSVTEGGKRWSIAADLDGPMRSYKAKLKCDSGEWPIVFTPEPVTSGKEISDFVDQIVTEWEGKSFDVKQKEEKALSL
jgi:hypothetical protein